jgi:hypothetical protein
MGLFAKSFTDIFSIGDFFGEVLTEGGKLLSATGISLYNASQERQSFSNEYKKNHNSGHEFYSKDHSKFKFSQFDSEQQRQNDELRSQFSIVLELIEQVKTQLNEVEKQIKKVIEQGNYLLQQKKQNFVIINNETRDITPTRMDQFKTLENELKDLRMAESTLRQEIETFEKEKKFLTRQLYGGQVIQSKIIDNQRNVLNYQKQIIIAQQQQLLESQQILNNQEQTLFDQERFLQIQYEQICNENRQILFHQEQFLTIRSKQICDDLD